jgi:hypothetical protein
MVGVCRPFPANIILKQDGVVVDGYGKILDFVSGPTITYDEEKGEYTLTFVSSDSFLKLDQTTPQLVENGSPRFQEGITIKAGQKLYFDGE